MRCALYMYISQVGSRNEEPFFFSLRLFGRYREGSIISLLQPFGCHMLYEGEDAIKGWWFIEKESKILPPFLFLFCLTSNVMGLAYQYMVWFHLFVRTEKLQKYGFDSLIRVAISSSTFVRTGNVYPKRGKIKRVGGRLPKRMCHAPAQSIAPLGGLIRHDQGFFVATAHTARDPTTARGLTSCVSGCPPSSWHASHSVRPSYHPERTRQAPRYGTKHSPPRRCWLCFAAGWSTALVPWHYEQSGLAFLSREVRILADCLIWAFL